MRSIVAVAAVIIASSASVVRAGFDELINFEEVALGTAVDGLSIKNVGFTFGGPPERGTATISLGPGVTPYVSAPVLEGPTIGTLGLHFAQPVTAFGFGFAMSVGGAVPNAVVVDVYDPQGSHLGAFTANGKAGNRGEYFFSSGQLTVLGLGPIGSAQVKFADYAPLGGNLSDGIPIVRFAFDNLGYDFAAVVIPLPTSGAMAAAGLICLAARRRRSV